MDFGILVLAKPNSCGGEAKLAEECGFSHAWVADTHMLSGDVYMCLALMAAQTSRITLGTGVAVPGGAYCTNDGKLFGNAQPNGARSRLYGNWDGQQCQAIDGHAAVLAA